MSAVLCFVFALNNTFMLNFVYYSLRQVSLVGSVLVPNGQNLQHTVIGIISVITKYSNQCYGH